MSEQILNTIAQHINLLAYNYHQENKPEPALEWLHKAIEFMPDEWSFYYNIAYNYNERYKYQEALEYINRAIELNPPTALAPASPDRLPAAPAAEVLNTKAQTLDSLKRYDECIEVYKETIEKFPNYEMAHFGLACTLSKMGKIKEAWPEFHHRHKAFPYSIKNRFAKPEWDGKPIDNLLVYNEQGVGDFIQYARFIPEIKKHTKRIITESQPELVSLLKSMKEIDERIPIKDTADFPDHDAIISITDLPYILDVDEKDIPIKPYFKAARSLKMRRLCKTNKKKVGIVWAGNKLHAFDKARSCALINFRRLVRNDVQLFSLQKGNLRRDFGDLGLGRELVPYIDLSLYIEDYMDTASAIMEMDLIVAVDTATAHLAGALGKPVHVLLAAVGDHRWQMDRGDSPWYPSVKLFRQNVMGDWSGVFDQLPLCNER